ncbi:MAG: hypothetical protein IT376_02740 [Polyangiaceae bacterium]|nr:hypothetical protein [Polyangiaceae bacterium]
MRWLSLLWLGVPLLGVGELAASRWASGRAPTADEWRALRAEVARRKRPGEPIAVAPAWAEPLARHALGDELMPLAEVARADVTSSPRVLEISALGARAPEVAGWRAASEEPVGRFVLRVLENPSPIPVRLDFVSELGPDRVSVSDGGRACAWTARGARAAGGLHGPVAYPAERFECGAAPFLVGVTVIEDQAYRPRRCVFAHATPSRDLRITYRGVPLGATIRGHAGLSWFLYRDGAGTPVELEVLVGGRAIGKHVHVDTAGWAPFELPLGPDAGKTADVTFVVRSESPRERQFCFHAESR